jgi:hypothetical protein
MMKKPAKGSPPERRVDGSWKKTLRVFSPVDAAGPAGRPESRIGATTWAACTTTAAA